MRFFFVFSFDAIFIRCISKKSEAVVSPSDQKDQTSPFELAKTAKLLDICFEILSVVVSKS